MPNIKTNFRCTNCWSFDRQCDDTGHCVHCGEDMHRRWPWNGKIVGCPVTGRFMLHRCEHTDWGRLNRPGPNSKYVIPEYKEGI